MASTTSTGAEQGERTRISKRTSLDLESFDVDDDNSDSGRSDDQESEEESPSIHRMLRTPQPRWRVVLRYLIAATTGVAFTIASPQTKLWMPSEGGETIHMERLAEVIAVYILTLVSLCAVQGSDPGYLTRERVDTVCQEDGLTLLGYEADQHAEQVEDGELSFNETEGQKSSMTRRTRSLDPLAPPWHDNGTDQEFYRGTRRKVCPVCEVAPPLRAHHCRVCNKCISTFDHHCHFISTCIGERNHCRFWWFLFCQGLGFLVCASTVSSSKLGFLSLVQNASWASAVVVMAKIYLFPLTVIALIMLVTHTVLALVNLTTFECSKGPTHIDYLRGTQGTDLPFSKGLDQNLRLFCCQRDACCDWLMGKSPWTPILWQAPGKIVRDSEDWWEHPWQNKYWSCC